ncbi:hypothetical protein N7449_002082 [Penicillium cf. viridicatum]|uniref:Uncharacterized protein n=1 Tax=Penicillium cf. viridicatum TaxID=2972119 RepID=A0A9W9MUF7_9EURO|nr:hypothetical protein N7449_002082 [Penicillium cf. viridicatum]
MRTCTGFIRTVPGGWKADPRIWITPLPEQLTTSRATIKQKESQKGKKELTDAGIEPAIS